MREDLTELPLVDRCVRKTLPDYFSDWESYVFGYGYGTGEEHTVPALQKLLTACTAGGTYDYRQLESACGPVAAWLLINALCHADIFEYGTSPRFGWLTEQGKTLRDFVQATPTEELIALANRDSDYTRCYPDACNCGPHGFEEGRRCGNPFWVERSVVAGGRRIASPRQRA